MNIQKTIVAVALACLTVQMTGCAVLAVADAVVTVGATAVKIGAKAVGAAVDLVIPDSDKKKENK